MVNDLNLLDSGCHGLKYTWCNNRSGEERIKERTGRALISTSWSGQFSQTKVIHEAVIGSDHTPLVAYTKWMDFRVNKQFKFESFWTTSEDCKSVIDDCWRGTGDDKLELFGNSPAKCRQKLQVWSKSFCPNNSRRIEELIEKLRTEQAKNLEEEDLNMEDELIGQINECWIKEEMYWHQRARNNWLNFGDNSFLINVMFKEGQKRKF